MKEDFGNEDLLKDMKQNIEEDIMAERQRIMDEFIKTTTDTINAHRVATKVIDLGKFHVRVQVSCDLVLPPKPDVPPCPVELECLTGKYEGEVMAKAVASITKGGPSLPMNVMARMGHCKLTLEKEIAFTVHNNCFGNEFEKYY